ncbi:MAG: hypothetical protein Q8J78_01215 [Moraxellaceae bacterium]|nr:hypothetical protein [Moraxellaceae bacterium]
MRFPVVVTLLWMPAAVVAAPESLPTPASHTSAFSGYQAWSEPAVRDWRETHALVMDEPSGYAGHTMGSSPDAQKEAPKESQDADMPGTSDSDMPHGGNR